MTTNKPICKKHGKPIAAASDMARYDKGECKGQCRCYWCRLVCFNAECYRAATKPKRKARKPGNFEMSIKCPDGSIAPLILTPDAGYPVTKAKQLHNWLTRYLAWSEQQQQKGE
jgi:hypothetical protein